MLDRNDVDRNDVVLLYFVQERMNGDTLWLLVARSELDKDTMVLLYDGREWQNWIG